MKQLIKQFASYRILLTGLSIFFLTACQKDLKNTNQPVQLQTIADNVHGHLIQANTFTSEVVIKWMNMQLRLMRTATGIPNNTFTRPYGYSGIALYEAVVHGMPAYQSLEGQLNGLSGLPQTGHGLAYYWPGSANAALAYINKNMFPATSDANKNAIDSLENALNTQYQGEADVETINRSIAFGKAVAQKVFEMGSDRWLPACK